MKRRVRVRKQREEGKRDMGKREELVVDHRKQRERD